MSNRSTEMIYATSSDVSIVTFTILSIVAIATNPAVAAFKDAYQNVVKAQQVLAAWEGPQYAAPTVCQYLKSNAQLEKRKDILRSTVPDNRDGFSDLSIHPEDPTGSLPTYQAVLKKHGKDMTKVVSFEEKMERAFKL
eukprot:gene14947-17668_t